MPFSPFFTRTLRYVVIIISLGFVCLDVSAQTIKYTYDALGRVRVVEDGVNGNRGYDYDAAGNRINVAGPDLVPPSKPSALLVSNLTVNSARVSWTASTDNVGVSGYEYSLNGGVWNSSGSSPSVNLSGLTPSTNYTFVLRAKDAGGNISDSASKPFTTLDIVVSAPGTPSFSNKTTTSVTAAWAASPTPGATYEWSINGGSSWNATSSTSVSVSGLAPSTSYTFSVRALYSGVRSGSSSAPFTTLDIVVSAPGTPSFSNKTTTSVTAAWVASPTSGATYEWSINGGSSWNATSSTSVSVSGLAPSTSYTFSVRALYSGVRSGSSSAPFTTLDIVVSPPGTPSFSNKTTTSVTASWVASPTSGATYEWSINGGSSWNATSSTSVSITGLTPSTGYTFSVRALYSNVRSGASSAPFTTLDIVVSPPGTPGFSNLTATSVTASWAPSATSGATYEWSINGGTSWNATSSTSVSVTGLTPYTSYTFSVRAVYSNVRSGASSASFTTPAIPLAMVGPLALGAATTTSISLSWNPATGSPGPDSYEHSLTNSAPWTNVGSNRAITVTGLSPNTSYTIYVRAKNALGTSAAISNTRSTMSVTLAAPTGLQCWQNWGPTAWKGQWNAVPGAHHYVFRAVNQPEVSVSGTNTGNTPIQQSTKPCLWVKACDANNNCGPQTYF